MQGLLVSLGEVLLCVQGGTDPALRETSLQVRHANCDWLFHHPMGFLHRMAKF